MGDYLSLEPQDIDEVVMSARSACLVDRMDKDFKSPESRSSCLFLLGSHILGPIAPTLPSPRRDIEEMKSGIEGLRQAVADMHGALVALQQDNLNLQRENRTLAEQNTHLLRARDDEEAGKIWSDFDVVEEHYRQIERHRTGSEEQGCDADFAAGISRSVVDPGKQEQLRAEALPRQHCIASPLWSARSLPGTLEQGPAHVF